jgi:hypothetical protein
VKKSVVWDIFAQKLLATPEFKAFMALPEYKNQKITGDAVRKHFNQAKEAAAVKYGWTGPKTGNLSDLADCPTKAVENIKAIWIAEEEEREEKQASKELKKDLDDTQNQVFRQTMSAKSFRNRSFYNLDGEIVDSKGKKKMKQEPEPSSTTSSSVANTDGSRGLSRSSTSSSNRYPPGSRFNPFDVESILDYVTNRKENVKEEEEAAEQKKLEAWEQKALLQQRKDVEMGGLMSISLARFIHDTSDENSKKIFQTIPFPILQKKFTTIGPTN